MSARSSALLALACAIAAPAAYAETLYVIERLVVSVTSSPDESGTRIALIRSGDRVEALERQNDHVYVRLENGEQGWVKAAYLSPELPLRDRLKQRTQELERTRQELQRVHSELAAARGAASSGRQPEANNDTATPGETERPGKEATGTPMLFMTRPEEREQPRWPWMLASSALALACGFVIGWRTLDWRIRRKYGGLRIY